MAIRLVNSMGNVTDPAVVNVYASGAIYKDGLVIFDTATNAVSRPTSASLCTMTSIFGVAQEHIDGASDVKVRVIPFADGQFWEIDTRNAITSTNLFLRHTMYDPLTVTNVTATKESASTGVFFAIEMTGSTSGSGKLIGKFLTHTPRKSGTYDCL